MRGILSVCVCRMKIFMHDGDTSLVSMKSYMFVKVIILSVDTLMEIIRKFFA